MSSDNRKFYITTTLPYVNAKPHIGHALEFVQADVIARWHVSRGDEVVFNVWTDEHGLKMLQKAHEAWMQVQDFIDMNVKTFEDFFAKFSISFSNFYRTSAQSHRAVAQTMWKQCMEAWDIYKKKYSWLYCVWCELFKTPKDLVDGKCPDHWVAPINFEQENYFFKLSKYRDQLSAYLKNNTVLLPTTRLQELLNFVDNMEDISISRTKESLPRWVPVPGDDEQVMYVWFDALSNYVGAIWYPDNMEKLHAFRPWVQIFGPDNLRFQWGIWQGMLASAWLPFSKHLLMHGMVLGTDGNKMSKTLWNVVDPMDQLELYGADAVRYYMIAWMPTFGDTAYKPEDLVNLVNSHLADGFGNLLSRVIALATKKEITLSNDITLCSDTIKQHIADAEQKIAWCFDAYELYDGVGAIHELMMFANKHINNIKPWDKETSVDIAKQCIIDLGVVLYKLVWYYWLIVPSIASKAKNMLDTMTKEVLFVKLV